MVFAIFYYIAMVLLYIIFLPLLFFKSFSTKYKDAIPARFFYKNSKFDKQGVWFHCCSMGELKAIEPMLETIKSKYHINLSVITDTGYKTAKDLGFCVRFLPFEIWLPFWIGTQKMLVVMEAELWYMMFVVAKKLKIKTVLINARVSDKSWHRYKKFSWFYKKIFKNIDKIFAQSYIDKERLELLGATNIEVVGNIKLSNKPIVTQKYQKPKDSFIITAGSTHEKEESLILDSFVKEKNNCLVIAPRHPQRFEVVNNLILKYIKNKDITYSRFSNNKRFDTDIVLVDCLGELVNIFAISDAVILGGGFEKIGGHNPIEVVHFDNILISGKHIFNQKELFRYIENSYMIDNDELKKMMKNIRSLKKAKLIDIGNSDKILKYIKDNNEQRKSI